MAESLLVGGNRSQEEFNAILVHIFRQLSPRGMLDHILNCLHATAREGAYC